MKLEHFLTPHTKINSKWIKETINYINRNYKTSRRTQAKLSDTNHNRILYDPPPRILEIRTKVNKWGLIKLRSVCTTKETTSKAKRQASEWEKIIANEATDKEFISKIYKPTHVAQYQKDKRPSQKRAKELNRHFSKEDIQMANKHMKRCSTLLIIREMQIKTTMRYHLTPIRMAAIQKSTNNKCWKGVEKRENSCTVGGNVN